MYLIQQAQTKQQQQQQHQTKKKRQGVKKEGSGLVDPAAQLQQWVLESADVRLERRKADLAQALGGSTGTRSNDASQTSAAGGTPASANTSPPCPYWYAIDTHAASAAMIAKATDPVAAQREAAEARRQEQSLDAQQWHQTVFGQVDEMLVHQLRKARVYAALVPSTTPLGWCNTNPGPAGPAVQQQRTLLHLERTFSITSTPINYIDRALHAYQKCLRIISQVPPAVVPTQEAALIYKCNLYMEIVGFLLAQNAGTKAFTMLNMLFQLRPDSKEAQRVLPVCLSQLVAADTAFSDSSHVTSFVADLVSLPQIEECEGLIWETLEKISKTQREANTNAPARVQIVNWLRRQITYHSKTPPTTSSRDGRMLTQSTISLQLMAKLEEQERLKELYLNSIMDYREHDCSPLVKQAAQEAIEAVGNFTLEVVEELEGGLLGDVITVQVFIDKLISNSEYFRTMLSVEMAEKKEKKIRIVTPNPSCFLDIITYLYTGEYQFQSIEHALAMALACNQYGMDTLLSCAREYLSDNLDDRRSYAATNPIKNTKELSPDAWRQIYDVCDALGFDNVKLAIIRRVSAEYFWSSNERSVYAETTAELVEAKRHIAEVFPELVTANAQAIINKLQEACLHTNFLLAKLCVDLLAKTNSSLLTKANVGMSMQDTTFPPRNVSDRSTCSFCGVVEGHLTTCRNFSRMTDITQRPYRGQQQQSSAIPNAPPPPAMNERINILEACAEKGGLWLTDIVPTILSVCNFGISHRMIAKIIVTNETKLAVTLVELLSFPSSPDNEKGKEKDGECSQDKESPKDLLSAFRGAAAKSPRPDSAFFNSFCNQKTLLNLLIQHQASLEDIQRFMKAGQDKIDINLPNQGDQGLTPLILALQLPAKDKNYRDEIVSYLLSLPLIDVHKRATGELEWTPLAFAVSTNETHLVELLLSKGARPEGSMMDSSPLVPIDFSPESEFLATATHKHVPSLFLACANSEFDTDSLEIALLLLSHKAEPDADRSPYHNTALMAAVYKGCTVLVNKLIEAGTDVNYANHRKWSALHFAAMQGHANIIRVLVSRGAKDRLVGIGTGKLVTAREIAEHNNFEEAAALLKNLKVVEAPPVHVLPEPEVPAVAAEPAIQRDQMYNLVLTPEERTMLHGRRPRGLFGRLRGL
eukprot:TRINITY_DN3222_c0_g1_i2.p1 TRINITY_DN3222_c0_g1~~TRINITY_DN3222_c0_g1_i2.p1  ORF type:complete len:1294 (-),score=192.58 TRINITY_DN3222_c0_g1_i2:105-3566(-)